MKKVVNYRPLFFIFVFLLCGIIMARKVFDKDFLVISILVLTIIAMVIWLCVAKKFKILCLLLGVFILGGGLFFAGKACYKVNEYTGQVAVVGRVTDSIKEGDHYYRVVLDDVVIEGKSDKNISLYISVRDGKTVKAGDKIAFESSLESVSLWTLKNFNSYYYRNNIGYVTSINSSSLVVIDGGLKLDESIRQTVKKRLEDNLSKENAGLCYALLFGDKIEISNDTLLNYKNAGIIHILAVSGLHVSFLLALLLGLMKLCKVNKYVSFVLATTFIIFFAYLCSFTPSVVRAGLMCIFFMLSRLLGRRYDTLSSLGLAGSIILLVSPLTAFDIGFLMSVFCVLGISMLSKLFTKVFVKAMPYSVASALSVSLSSQIITLPFTAYFGGKFNFLSPFVNLIIVPFFGILFPYLVVASFVSAILPFMGFILAPAGWGFSAVTSVVRFFGNTSLYLPIEKVHVTVMIMFFVLIFVFSKFVLLPFNKKSAVIGTLAILLSICGLLSPLTIKSDLQSAVQLCSSSSPCYVLTSSSGERMLVGYNSLVENYAREYNARKFDYFLSFEPIDEEDTLALASFGTRLFVACSGDNSCENTMYSSAGECGEFEYEFLKSENKILGVGIKFDETKIFIATGASTRYNQKYEEYFDGFKPSVVFVGENDEIGHDYVTISLNKNGQSWTSFEENGNMKFIFESIFVYKEALD